MLTCISYRAQVTRWCWHASVSVAQHKHRLTASDKSMSLHHSPHSTAGRGLAVLQHSHNGAQGSYRQLPLTVLSAQRAEKKHSSHHSHRAAVTTFSYGLCLVRWALQGAQHSAGSASDSPRTVNLGNAMSVASTAAAIRRRPWRSSWTYVGAMPRLCSLQSTADVRGRGSTAATTAAGASLRALPALQSPAAEMRGSGRLR